MKNKISVKIVNGIVWIDDEEYSIGAARALRDRLSFCLSDKSESLVYLSKEATDAWKSDLREEYRSAGDATDLLKDGEYIKHNDKMIVRHEGKIITFTNSAEATINAEASGPSGATSEIGHYPEVYFKQLNELNKKIQDHFGLK